MLDNLKEKDIIDWYGTNPKDPKGKYKIKNI